MIKPTPPPTSGFTLIEVLIAVTIAVISVALVVTALPRAAGQAAQQTADVRAATRANAVTQLLSEQFREDTFQGFTTGTNRTLTAVFSTDAPVKLPPQRDFNTITTINAPGLNVPNGGAVLLVSASGASKLVTVTGTASPNVSISCPTGLPSAGAVLAYPARTLTLNLTGETISRTTRGVTTTLGSSQGTSFAYLYQSDDGTLVRDPEGTPANRVPSGTLVGLLPAGASSDARADRTAAIPLQVTPTTRILACTESAASTPSEGRVNVSITGLPSGVTPNVTVGGPDPAVNGQKPSSSRSYQGVQRGTYTLTGQTVTSGGRTYVAQIRGSPATLHNTWGQVFLAASYREARGTLTLTVNGLPGGAQGTVTLTGPETRSVSVPSGTTSLDLVAGSYALTASPVTVSGVTYTPTAPASVTIAPNGSAAVSVVYTPPSTTLKINVSGLQDGATTTISYKNLKTSVSTTRITGNGTWTVSGIAPGSYLVKGAPWGQYTAENVQVSLVAGAKKSVFLIYTNTYTSDPPPTDPPPLPVDPPPIDPPPQAPSPAPSEPPPSDGGGGGPPACFYDGVSEPTCGF